MTSALDAAAPAVDLADLWLARGFDRLVDSCGPTDEQHRLDAARETIAFATLAVEARINRIVRTNDELDWNHDATLTPLEKFQLVPQLLHESQLTRHNELAENVVELFDLQAELVETVAASTRVDPERARRAVLAAAEICSFLDATDRRAADVVEAAVAIEARACAASIAGAAEDASGFPPTFIGA